ncbi:MAG: OmpA family protein [Bacteroidota bacterium]
MNFQMSREGKNGPFRFQLLDENSNLVMESISFPNRDTTINAMRQAVRQLRNQNLDPSPLENGFGWRLRAEDDSELMRSQIFAEETVANQALNALQQAARDKQTFEVSMTVVERAATFRRPNQEVDFSAFYDFLFSSPEGTPGFEAFRRTEKKEPYYFHFNNAQGLPILYSRGFDSIAKRDKRIRTVLKNVEKEARYQSLESPEGAFFILKASNGTEIARSGFFANATERDQALLDLKSQAPDFKAAFPAPQKSKRKETYRLDVPSESGAAGFESFQNKIDRRHYFHLNDSSGRALIFSQAYLSKKSRNNGMRALAQNGNQDNRLDPQAGEEGYFFLVRGGNRQAVAKSRYFASAAERDQWMLWFQSNVREYAAAFGIKLTETTATEVFSLEVENASLSGSVGIGAVGAVGAVGAALGTLSSTSDNGGIGAESNIDNVKAGGAIISPAEQELEEVKDDILTAEEGDELSPWTSNAPVAPTDAGAVSKARPWWLWLLLGLVALLLLFFLFRACGDNAGIIPPSDNVEIENRGADPEIGAVGTDSMPESARLEAGSPSAKTVGLNDSASSVSTIPEDNEVGTATAEAGTEGLETPIALGPNGAALGFRKGSMLYALADHLSDPNSSLPKLFTLDEIDFGFNSAHMNKSAYGEVNGLAKILKAYPNAELDIYGHIDGSESDDYDGRYADEITSLSGIRARCLYKKLNQRGISLNRLNFEGFAATKPLGDKKGKANRRLEIVLTGR